MRLFCITFCLMGLYYPVISIAFDCNMPIASFFSSQAILKIPSKIEGQKVKSIQALVYFRESHGGYQSCFSLKNLKNDNRIDLFCEKKWSDHPMIFRGGNDWLGTVEGGILGDQLPVKIISLAPETPYQMVIWGHLPPHEEIADTVKTNFNDPIPDGNFSLFTFYEETKLNKIKSLTFKHAQIGVSTILGFEDKYMPELENDYNDIILEMCLRIDY